MKKTFILILALSLILCGCSSSFDMSKGSVLDKEFFQTFPFQSYAMGDGVNWFNNHKGYKIQDADDETIQLTYQGSVKWDIDGSCEVYKIDGYYFMFRSFGDYSDNDYSTIYNCIIDELTELCGNPSEIFDEGTVAFYHDDLRILVNPGQGGIVIEMYCPL